MLTPEQRTLLLQIARESIAAALERRAADLDRGALDPELTRPSGAFVSLHTADGDLRGCIGSIEAVAPLCEAVSSNAVYAATRDPRFYPLRREELADVVLEISVMSPIERVSSIQEIEVGRDGLIVHGGGRTGLLLPQVATEYGWDREAFLSQTCVKAGLAPESWRTAFESDSRSIPVRIERFSAEVFSEQNAC
jgi:AmmeMemoRadiSam system protein A